MWLDDNTSLAFTTPRYVMAAAEGGEEGGEQGVGVGGRGTALIVRLHAWPSLPGSGKLRGEGCGGAACSWGEGEARSRPAAADGSSQHVTHLCAAPAAPAPP